MKNRGFIVVKSEPMSYRQIHDTWPAKEALVYDVVDKPYMLTSARVYAVGDDCVDAIDLFVSEFPVNNNFTIVYTSPEHDNGTPIFSN